MHARTQLSQSLSSQNMHSRLRQSLTILSRLGTCHARCLTDPSRLSYGSALDTTVRFLFVCVTVITG